MQSRIRNVEGRFRGSDWIFREDGRRREIVDSCKAGFETFLRGFTGDDCTIRKDHKREETVRKEEQLYTSAQQQEGGGGRLLTRRRDCTQGRPSHVAERMQDTPHYYLLLRDPIEG